MADKRLYLTVKVVEMAAMGGIRLAQLFGRQWTKYELLRHVGNIGQLGGVRRHMLTEGRGSGMEVVEFRTGSGLSFDVSLSRALDISRAEYCGQALAWCSSAGDVAPKYYEPHGRGWLRSFSGGLVATCGLSNAGASGTDEGESLGMHGRVGNLPAENVYVDGAWDGDDYVMWAQGKIRETTVFGENLLLTRRVAAKLGESKIWIDDLVANEGSKASEFMFLYHINLGFPVVSPDARLLAPQGTVVPRDADAKEGQEHYATFDAPTRGYREKVYYHDLKADHGGYITVAIANPEHGNCQGLGVYVRYKKAQLPQLIQWKMMDEQTYVVGLEPANCLVEGRAKERQRGTLQFLAPGEERQFQVEIGVLPTLRAIRELERSLAEGQ